MFLFGRCYSLIVTTSEFKSRGSGETLAIWISRFLPLWSGIVWHGIFCIIILCLCIMLFVLYYYWVGFKLFTKSWKLFPSFDCPEKWLIHYVSYYVRKGASFTSAQCLVHLVDFSLCLCLGGAIRSFLLHHNSNFKDLVRLSPFEFLWYKLGVFAYVGRFWQGTAEGEKRRGWRRRRPFRKRTR